MKRVFWCAQHVNTHSTKQNPLMQQEGKRSGMALESLEYSLGCLLSSCEDFKLLGVLFSHNREAKCLTLEDPPDS